MNRKRMRGPSCCDTSVNATSVIEKTSDATVIIDPAIVESSRRALSSDIAGVRPELTERLICSSVSTKKIATTIATSESSAGMNQKLDLIS